MDRKPTSTQSASHRVISGAGIQFALQLIGQVLALVVTRELLSTFSIAENGVFAFIQRTGTVIFTLFVDAGMMNFAIRYTVSSPDETNEILSTLFKLRLALWAIVTTVMVGCGAFLAPEYTLSLLWWSIYFLFSAKVGLLRSILETVYRAHARFVFISVLGILDILILMILLLADLTKLSVHTVIVWYLLSSIPGFLILFVKIKGWNILMVPFSGTRARQLFHDILPFIGTTVLLYMNGYLETLFLTFFGGMKEVGVFEAVGRIIIPTFMIIGSLVNGIYPFIVQFQKEDLERCKQYVFYGFKFTVIISLLMAIGLILTTPWIIHFFTGNNYASNTNEFMLYSWVITPNFCITYVLSVCVALGLQKRTFAITLALTGFGVIFDLIMIPLWMVPGAIVAKFLANIISWWVAVRILNEFFQDSRINDFLVKFIPVSLVILTGASIALYELPIIASLVLILSIFVILMVVTRIVDKSDLRLIQSFVVSIMSKVGIQRN